MLTDSCRAWSASLAYEGETSEPPSYLAATTSGLADRCAQAVTEWGPDFDKTAAQVEPQQLYKDPDAHPLVLLLMVLDRYGPDSMDWDPEVLRVTMMRDNYQVSGASWAKLMAARVLLASPSPWRQWQVFHWVARALGGYPPNFTYLEQPELGHLFVASDLMKIVDPQRPTVLEVDKFVAATLRHEGQVWAPESLAFATRALEDPHLECQKCRALFGDDNDQRCVTCSAPATALVKVPYAHAALRDQCKALWVPRRDLPLERAVDGLGEDAAGNLVYELLLHWDHARRVRRLLLAQLHGLAR
jgi:hypothetical protein